MQAQKAIKSLCRSLGCGSNVKPLGVPHGLRSFATLRTKARKNYYADMDADYSRVGLVSDDMKAKLIKRSELYGKMKEAKLPEIGPDYTLEQIEKENREFWPSHCEALRQNRGDLLGMEYRSDLVYHCQDGPYYGIKEQNDREKYWWAILSQPGVTMVWPIVQIWGEFTHFEWICLDDTTNAKIAYGNVCWVRRGHRGGCYYKSEQLTFVRDVYPPKEVYPQ